MNEETSTAAMICSGGHLLLWLMLDFYNAVSRLMLLRGWLTSVVGYVGYAWDMLILVLGYVLFMGVIRGCVKGFWL